MKHFKKKGCWVFYGALVLAGAFIIVALGLQNQSPVIPDLNAQTTPGSISNYGFYDYTSSNLSGYAGSFSPGYNILSNLGSYRSSFGFMDVQGSQGPSRTMHFCDGPSPSMYICDGPSPSMYICDGYTNRYCYNQFTLSACSLEPYRPPPTTDTCYAFCSGNTIDTCFSFLCTVGGGIPGRFIYNIPTPSSQTFGSALCGGGQTYGSVLLCGGSQTFGSALCGGGQTYYVGTCGYSRETLNLTQSPPY